MSKISVIIPVYNSEKYLAETINSVINQSFKDIEIICVDDGSTDNSFNILDKYRKEDNRIKVVKQNNNGVVSARNCGANIASGDYLFFLDSDDLIDTNLLEKAYEAIINQKGDVITCRVLLFNSNLKREMPLLLPSKKNMAFSNCLVNASLFSRELFLSSGGFDHKFDKGLEDYDLYLNFIYRQNATFYRIPEILFHYRIKNTNESRNSIQKKLYKNELKVLISNKYPELLTYKNNLNFIVFFIKKIGKYISCFF